MNTTNKRGRGRPKVTDLPVTEKKILTDGTIVPVDKYGRAGKQHYTHDQKLQIISVYLTCDSPVKTSELTGVDVNTIKYWRKQSWWDELVAEIYSRDAQKKSSKISRIVDKALDLVQDRLDHGDYMYDPKSGKVIRTPVKLRDLNNATNTLIEKQELLKKRTLDKVDRVDQKTHLEQLAQKFVEFAKASNKKTNTIDNTSGDIVDVEEIKDVE